MLSETISRIGELQRSWSKSNTPEMAERGVLIRKTMVAELEEFRNEFVESLATQSKQYGDDLGIEGSDGSGNKGAAPWVRIFSKHMSPSASAGFYLVFHFSIDGQRLYLTLGCPATRDGTNPLSRNEIKKTVSVGKRLLEEGGEPVSSFSDQIVLGESTSTAQRFALATVIAKQYDIDNLSTSSLVADTNKALVLLSTIYVGQDQGKHLSPADLSSAEVEERINPVAASGRGQGYGLDGKERKVVEIQAMQQAASYLESEGYTVTDESANASFDLLAEKNGEKIKVEVKGTTSKRADSFLMTKNEVALHHNEKELTGLIIVYDIDLKRGATPEARPGLVKVFLPWDVSGWEFEGHTYRVTEKD